MTNRILAFELYHPSMPIYITGALILDPATGWFSTVGSAESLFGEGTLGWHRLEQAIQAKSTSAVFDELIQVKTPSRVVWLNTGHRAQMVHARYKKTIADAASDIQKQRDLASRMADRGKR